ncbi:YcaO-like family protein [Agrobacterium sp. rho-13.3]|uniref:YcaO-like family protein n=1 Tax=Agrobacterium sp. rho-13.3 TaxID=3072980 RepID=UPI002A12E062|nr:YcaO-like family protein [Agrobacterium sp. rho-13.3]MDX8309175.1 YcaO-like family protein [Agrobacterium sp. rho-13.3]
MDEHHPYIDPVLLRQFGITRVGDVTDLDTIGVPVWFAVRPNSRGLSVSQGKGLTAGQARISAVMEALEGAVAEDTQKHLHTCGSIAEMTGKHAALVPYERLGRVDTSMIDPDRERAWVRGMSVRDGHHVLAPFELIGMDFRVDFPWDRRAFQMSSEGLAAGFHYDRTVLHALLELIENDACFLIDAFDSRNVAPRPVSFPASKDSPLEELLQRLQALDIQPRFFELPAIADIPVVMASVPRLLLTESGPTLRRAAGVACRLDWQDAALAALLEAIQARLTDINGARDDLTPSRYRIDDGAPIQSPSTVHDLNGVKSVSLFQQDRKPLWRSLADHLFAAGIRDIYVFSLETGVDGLYVVRVLADGLSAAGKGLQTIPMRAFDGLVTERTVR